MTSSEACPRCGIPLSGGICRQCTPEEVSRSFHRDILLLVILALLAMAVFLFTRGMAAKERALDTRVAATWFQRGQRSVQAGDLERAITCFRKATANNRENRVYTLALANALAAAGHNPEARQTLLSLRETSPEDAEINLHLARLAAKRGDVQETLQYYHSALYGLWSGSRGDEERRNARLELIQFLLNHNESSRALSELLILNTEIPADDSALQKQTADLFLKAGDPARALTHYKRAIDLDRNNSAAFAGAGEAAFELTDYALAERYFEIAAAKGFSQNPTLQLLTLVKTILSNDPLAPGLSWAERRRRMAADYDQSLRRLQACLVQQSGKPEGTDSGLDALQTEALVQRSKLRRNSHFDSEQLRSGLELIYRIEEGTRTRCGQSQGLDRVLLLISRKHAEARP